MLKVLPVRFLKKVSYIECSACLSVHLCFSNRKWYRFFVFVGDGMRMAKTRTQEREKRATIAHGWPSMGQPSFARLSSRASRPRTTGFGKLIYVRRDFGSIRMKKVMMTARTIRDPMERVKSCNE